MVVGEGMMIERSPVKWIEMILGTNAIEWHNLSFRFGHSTYKSAMHAQLTWLSLFPPCHPTQ